jgi:hypothetical protein
VRRSDGKGEGDGMIRSEGGDWEDVLDGDESDGEVKKWMWMMVKRVEVWKS